MVYTPNTPSHITSNNSIYPDGDPGCNFFCSCNMDDTGLTGKFLGVEDWVFSKDAWLSCFRKFQEGGYDFQRFYRLNFNLNFKMVLREFKIFARHADRLFLLKILKATLRSLENFNGSAVFVAANPYPTNPTTHWINFIRNYDSMHQCILKSRWVSRFMKEIVEVLKLTGMIMMNDPDSEFIKIMMAIWIYRDNDPVPKTK